MRHEFFHTGPDFLWSGFVNQRQDVFVIPEIADVNQVLHEFSVDQQQFFKDALLTDFVKVFFFQFKLWFLIFFFQECNFYPADLALNTSSFVFRWYSVLVMKACTHTLNPAPIEQYTAQT